MNARPAAATLAVLGLAIASAAAAQEPLEPPKRVALDHRVRIDFIREIKGEYSQSPILREHRTAGFVTSLGNERIGLRREGEAPVSIPFSSVEKIGISLGKSRSQGALRGLAWGLVIGSAAALLIDSQDSSHDPDGQISNTDVALLIGGTMAAGAVIGYGVGAERWHDVPVHHLWQD